MDLSHLNKEQLEAATHVEGPLLILAGVLIFGPVWGFIYNYAGICAGSLAAFFLSRKYGLLWFLP